MVSFIVIAVVSGSLVLGAAWGIYGNLPDRVEGLIVALAGRIRGSKAAFRTASTSSCPCDATANVSQVQ